MFIKFQAAHSCKLPQLIYPQIFTQSWNLLRYLHCWLLFPVGCCLSLVPLVPPCWGPVDDEDPSIRQAAGGKTCNDEDPQPSGGYHERDRNPVEHAVFCSLYPAILGQWLDDPEVVISWLVIWLSIPNCWCVALSGLVHGKSPGGTQVVPINTRGFWKISYRPWDQLVKYGPLTDHQLSPSTRCSQDFRDILEASLSTSIYQYYIVG